MFSAANKISKTAPVVQLKATANTFFRKAGMDQFFGGKESASFFGKPVQTKLTVSKPDDPQEKEADVVADKVMRMPAPVMTSALPVKKEENLQRKEEEEVQAKQQIPVVNKIQCKETAGIKLQAKLSAEISKSAEKQVDAKLQNSVDNNSRNINAANISVHHPTVMRQSERGPPAIATPFEQTLSSSKGSGSALPGDTRTFMESRFNADFSGVRIHTDKNAQHLSSSINAQAFAHGNDIYFNSGKFSPNSTEGGTLLAHELTHTIQQGASKNLNRVSIKNKISPNTIVWKKDTDNRSKVNEHQTAVTDQRIANKEDDISRKNETAKPEKNKAPPETRVSPLPIQPKAATVAKSKITSVQPVMIALAPEKKELQKKEQEQEQKENATGSHEFLVKRKCISRSMIPELHKCPNCASISRKPADIDTGLGTTYANSHTCAACSTVLQASERGPPLSSESITIGYVQPGTLLQRDEEAPPEKSWLDKLKETFESTLAELLPASVYNFYSKIKNGGLLNYIKDILAGLFKGLFGKLGFSEDQIQVIFEIFARLKSQLPAIIEGLAKGDCKPLFAALDLLSEVVGAIAGKVWDNLMAELEPVRLWLIDIWDTFGAPVVEEIKYFFGEQWEALKALGKFIWDSFKPIRDVGEDAWDWVVKKLGFGTSDEPGLLSYVSDKLGEAWQNIKTELKPVIEPVNEVIEGIKTLASLTDIQKLKEDAQKWLDEVVKTATAMGSDEDAVASKQLTLRQVLLPALNKSIDRLKGTLQSAADWLTEKVGFIAGKVTAFLSGLQGNDYLAPMYPIIKWLPAAVDKLKDWATDKVSEIFTKIKTGVDHLKQFVEPLLKLLEKLVSVAGNLLKYLPDLILGVPFMFMPRCIKDPIIKWLTEVVLKQIPIIGDFIALTEHWEEIKAAALLVLKQVFVDGLLVKGLWNFFKALLKIIGIDANLVAKVVAKAASNFSAIISKPGAFLKNIWGVMKGGFALFWNNIGKHLLTGALDWLFGEVKGEEPIEKPAFTISGILGFVLKLFRITKENVYERMRKNPRIGPEKVKLIQDIEKVLTGALEWISVWIKEGPDGLLKKIKTQLGDLKNMVIQGVVSWVTTKITEQIMKKLATSVDPLGIGATINVIIQIYDAIKAAISYFNRILNIVNDAMDNMAEIIAGNTASASKKFEGLLGKAVPVVIGFAVEAVLGKVGVKIKEIIDKVRKKIDDTIDALINGALNFIDGIIATGKKAAGKVLGWLGLSKDVPVREGETHKLYFNQQSKKLMIASAPIVFGSFLDTINIPSHKAEKLNPIKSGLMTRLQNLDNLIANNALSEQQKTTKIQATLELMGPEIAELIRQTSGISLKSEPPQYGGTYGGFGSSMKVRIVDGRPATSGSQPSISGGNWDILKKRQTSSSLNDTFYIRAHLLNDNLGGPGNTWSNLSILSQMSNNRDWYGSGSHETAVESRLKGPLGQQGKGFIYIVTANYGRSLNTALLNLVNSIINYKNSPSTSTAPSIPNDLNYLNNYSVEKLRDLLRVISAEQFVPASFICTIREIDPADGKEVKGSDHNINRSIGNNIAGTYFI